MSISALLLLFAFVMIVLAIIKSLKQNKKEDCTLDDISKSDSIKIPEITSYRKKRNFVNEFIAFDIETTGLDAGKHEIIQIAAVHFKDNRIFNQYSSYIKPLKRIPSEATAIHNITNNMVKDASSIGDVLPEFINFIGDHVLVGHNSSFDMKFILHELNNLGIQLNNQVADTFSLSKKYFPHFSNHKLVTVAKKLKIDYSEAHNAIHDAIACGQVYCKCRDLENQLRKSKK